MFVRGFGRVGRPGLLGTMARTAVVAGTATAVSGGMLRHQQRRAEEQQEAEAYEQQQQPIQPSAAVHTDTDALIGQLNQLADLKSRGVLTDAEFEAEKAKLLGS